MLKVWIKINKFFHTDFPFGLKNLLKVSQVVFKVAWIAGLSVCNTRFIVQVMTVFKYIEDKDVFQKFYSKMLAKRLVQVSSNQCSESE